MSRKTRRSRRGRVPALVILVLAVGALVLWTRSGDTTPVAAGATPIPPSTGAAPSGVTPSNPAPSDPAPSDDADEPVAQESDEASAETPSRPTATTAAPEDGEDAGPAPVAVSLTYTGYDAATSAVVAGGYAADVTEVDATCTLVLRRDGVELRGESLGTPSATTTDCGEVRVGGDALTSGTWEAVLGYTSETSAGVSAAVEVEVP
jgi:cytoskeletal protein RodZ